ncbi:MAG: protease pro-enzyme activation domain-containing protein [Opitutaceae bacterium]
MDKPQFLRLRALTLALFVFAALTSNGAVVGARVRLEDSIKEVPVGAPDSGPHRVRETLTAAESAESLNLVVSLRMRNFGEFESVIQSGRTPSAAEMEAKYLPLAADYKRVSAWLAAQGLTPSLIDANHTNLFFHGTVAQIAAALEVSFARVATADGEFTSAVSAPSLPQEFSSAVLGIEGLQPHIRMHAPRSQPETLPAAFVHPTRAIPADLLSAYHVPSTLNGAGQTIAIFTDYAPLASDLATFYTDAGVDEVNPTFTVVPVNGGPTPEGSQNEASLDAEWSTGIAPGANLRIYAAPTGSLTDFVTACTQILNDGVAKIVSSSYSNPETLLAPASMQSCSQLLAQMAAAGITVFHGSGDSGSYGSAAAPEYPPTDPYVTALGGTAIVYDANWNETGETVWANTGGGYSTFFAQPSWQAGPGVPKGTLRCVPDAAAPSSMISASGTLYSFVVINGATDLGIGGDSLTGPIWAGLTAIINQARANAGLPTVGLLGPRIYPLIGTSAFKDITLGNNGAYSAGPGYDLCSGVGSPNVTALIQALANEPAFLVEPSSQTIAFGSTVVFTVSASGTPAPTLQWFLNGTAIPNATGSTLVVAGASAANAGSYTCVASNSITSVTSLPATLNLVTTSDPGRLTNISCRAPVGTGGNILIAGFAVGGQGTSGSEPLLVRGSGPALVPFGVSGTLPDPQLQVFSGSSLLAIDNGWLGSSQIASAAAAVGAFAWSNPSSHDSALFENLQGGPYTAQISGQSGDTGVALAEVYDATPAGTYTSASPRLVNISARVPVGSGANILIAGFVIGGSTARTVLVRASGPALVPFGVSGTLPDPQLELFSGSTELEGNNGWGGNPQISNAAKTVGAFAWTSTQSNDSAILVTLPPGAYTAQVSGASGDTGVALVEVYEVP